MKRLVRHGFGLLVVVRSLAEEGCIVDSSKKACAAGIRRSVAVEESLSGGLRRHCGKNATKRYLTGDAMTGAIIEWCDTKERPLALPVSKCDETRIGAIAVKSDECVYYTTGQSVRSLKHSIDIEIVGVYAEILIRGDRFGTKPNELLSIRLRGKGCGAFFWLNKSYAICQVVDPALLGPAAPPLTPACITLTTRHGGLGGFKQHWEADLDLATYGKLAAPPAIFNFSYTFQPLPVRPTGLTLGRNDSELFFSSIGSGLVKPTAEAVFRILFSDDGHIIILAVPWITQAPRITALTIDPEKKIIYYSDAHTGRLALREASAPSGPAANDRTVANIPEPRGLAFDPSASMNIYLASARNIVRIVLTDLFLHTNSSTILTPEPIVLGDIHAAPDAILLLPLPKGNALIGDRSKRLFWLDANLPAIQASTRHGTRRIDLIHANLRFPRALATASPSADYFYVGEWLGRIFKLSPSSVPFLVRGDRAEISNFNKLLVRSDVSTATASTIRSLLDAEDLDRQRLRPNTLQTVLTL